MDVIKMARELGKVIQQSPEFARIDAAKKANDADSQLQVMIEDFNKKRVALNMEVSKEDKDPEKLAQMDKELKELYQVVMSNPNMVEFNAAKGDVDKMMNFVTEILYASVNGEDPDTVEESTGGCSGNCGSCGGCH